MKKIKYRIRNFFGFSKKETNGFLLLLLLIVFLLAAPWLMDIIYRPTKASLIQDEEKLDSMIVLLEKASLRTFKEARKESPATALFYFNPNLEKEEQLKKIFGAKTARTIVRFREKGGKFKIKKDMTKIYGLDSLTFKRIEKYILLPESGKKEQVPVLSSVSSSHLRMDINKADTLELKALKGIGKILAIRIIKYRNKLGGYISTDQFHEIYGLDSLVISELKRKFFINAGFIPQKINLAKATQGILEAHPYIGKKHAKAIVAYRDQHNGFNSIDELNRIPSIAKEDLLKMAPYIEL